MRKAFIYLTLVLMAAALASCAGKDVEKDSPVRSFLQPLQERDSVLIADQLLYGFEIDGVTEGTKLIPAEIADSMDQSILSLSPWVIDTVDVRKNGKENPKTLDIKGSVRIAPFLEGEYELPSIEVTRIAPDGAEDTLVFDPLTLEVKTMPVDTTTFQRHPMKGVVQTPFNWDEFVYTVKELWTGFIDILPILMICKWAIILIIVGVCVWLINERRNSGAAGAKSFTSEPAHIVALRKLDAFRSNAMWVPERQKEFYTGVTDALREYISRRYIR